MPEADKIAVICGGPAAEQEVSRRTGKAVQQALQEQGYAAQLLEAGWDLAAQLQQQHISRVFVALHGRYGEDGRVQGLLEWLRIPYTGSGVMASAVAMDKALTKYVLQARQLRTPEYGVCATPADVKEVVARLGYPLVVKPAREGSTIGISIVHQEAQLQEALTAGWRYDRRLVLERYIAGREMTVSVLNGQALPVIEIVPQSGFYDYEAKYTPGHSEYYLPAPIDQKSYTQLQSMAQEAYVSLDCAGAVRVDFILDQAGTAFCLEVNTIPGMTETSLLPKAAAATDISFQQLTAQLLQEAALDK